MYIAYVKSPAGTVITQIHGISEVVVQARLNDTWSASFKIRWDNEANTLSVLQEFNRVKLYKQESTWVEKLLFEGYMKAPETDDEWTYINMGDMGDFFKTKFLWVGKTYTWSTLDFILTDILSDVNARFATWITLDCWVTDVIPDKTYSEGQDIYSIFQDLIAWGYEFKIEKDVLYFKTSIWIDRTIPGENYLEYTFDKDNSSSNTIINPKTTFNSENIANYVKVKWPAWIVTRNDAASIITFWSVERFISSSWTNTTTADQILLDKKDSTREIDVAPVSFDFFEVWVGDTVQIYINSKNVIWNYTWGSKVLEKKYISWDLEKVSIKLSTSQSKTLTLLETIIKIKERQKHLEL